MDLSTILFRRPQLAAKVEAQGFDKEALFALCDELFTLTDDLRMSPLEAGEFVLRIKNAATAMRNQHVKSHSLYDKIETEPVRLSIENSGNKKAYFFKLMPGTSTAPPAIFKCEDCGAELQRSEAKEHVLRVHD
mmetsp:Transcript_28038/g.50218  ORF Transcript_28038/g.50218 Transcript_28038/m.50218 type:complete len:134 (-) Transcript_28038:8-409(-)